MVTTLDLQRRGLVYAGPAYVKSIVVELSCYRSHRDLIHAL